jgi:hypothetical protein
MSADDLDDRIGRVEDAFGFAATEDGFFSPKIVGYNISPPR